MSNSMVRGYQCIIIAVLGWLVLAASPIQSDRPQNSTGPNDSAEQSLKDIASALKEANKSKEPDPGCERGEDNRKSDLCAQWKAADAAYEGAVWSRRTYYLTAIGLVIGGLTLIAAGFAALYAKRAAEETRAANTIAKAEAERAEREAAAAKKSLVQAERAIITVCGAMVMDAPIGTSSAALAHIELKNSGRTNATNFQIFYRISDIAEYHSKSITPVNSAGICTPNSSIYLEPIQIRRKKKYPAFIIGFVSYSTMHEANFRTYFCLKMEGLPYTDSLGSDVNAHAHRHACARLPKDT